MHNKLVLLNIHYLSVHHKNMPLNPMQINPHSLYTMVENMTVPKIIYLTTIPPSWGLLVIPESSCEGVFPKNCCQFQLLTSCAQDFLHPLHHLHPLHLHHIHYLHLLHLYFIYINLIYIIYIIHLHHEHNLQVLSGYISPTKLLRCHLHRSSYIGVLTQEIFDRSCYTGVVIQELLHTSLLPGDLRYVHLNSYKTSAPRVLLNSLFWRQGQPGHVHRNVTLCGGRGYQTHECVVKCEFSWGWARDPLRRSCVSCVSDARAWRPSAGIVASNAWTCVVKCEFSEFSVAVWQWASSIKNCGKIAMLKSQMQPLRPKWRLKTPLVCKSSSLQRLLCGEVSVCKSSSV